MGLADEIYALVLSVAGSDDNIRAVAINGSRVNPAVTPDEFQDFDIVYFVRDMAACLKEHNWVDVFGERIIMQMPDLSDGLPLADYNKFAYLMQFTDGNRIDLTLRELSDFSEYLKEDTLVKVLLNKDNLAANIAAPNDSSHHVEMPTQQTFAGCQNEFWWVSTYVAKGLCRGEQLYAIAHMHGCVLHELLRMVGWQIGFNHGFKVNLGKDYKFLASYLGADSLQAIYRCYDLSTPQKIWDSLFSACELMADYSAKTGEKLGYPADPDAPKVAAYLRRLYKIYEETASIK